MGGAATFNPALYAAHADGYLGNAGAASGAWQVFVGGGGLDGNMMGGMNVAECTFEQAPEILAIFNEAIVNSTAIYDYEPRTMANMEAWFEAKRRGKFPVIGVFEDDGRLAGFASFGTFRAFPAYKYSVEHSIYVEKERRGHGLGKLLMTEIIQVAQQREYHTMIGVIDAANAASIRLHQQAGFAECANIKQAGFKFGRWLDVVYYQLILATPTRPVEG